GDFVCRAIGSGARRSPSSRAVKTSKRGVHFGGRFHRSNFAAEQTPQIHPRPLGYCEGSRSWVADNAVCLLHAAVAFVCHMRGDAAKGGGPSRIVRRGVWSPSRLSELWQSAHPAI